MYYLSLFGLLLPLAAEAADHAEAPGTAADPAADITDFYAWHSGGRLTVALNYTQPAGSNYDADVLYGIHIDETGDLLADHDLWIRFGKNGAGEWGVQVTGVPGASAALEGAANATVEMGSTKVFTGLRDDPFFMDFTGFQDTLSTGAVSFDGSRDTFAGSNVMSIVVEFPTTGLGDDVLSLWATTARK